jgi:uncharacterized protein
VNELFADTGFWVAQLLPDNALHPMAREWARKHAKSSKIITSDFVLTEFLNYVSKFGTFTHNQAIQTCQHLYAAEEIVIITAHRTLLMDAMDLYRDFSDKQWSLTDCSSFVIMRERNITDALTHDHHFEQAGFKTLL